MKKLLLATTIMCLLFSCKTSSLLKSNLEGTYSQDEFKNIKLKFSKELFVCIDYHKYDHLAVYHCSDTIAFGRWEKDKSYPFISLYSNPIQYASMVDLQVLESYKEGLDSLDILISNPIEHIYINNNDEQGHARNIYYTMYIESDDLGFDRKANKKKYYTNNIKLKLSKGQRIKTFEITAHPIDCSFGWRLNMPPNPVSTIRHTVKNQRSNVFKVNIPNLSYCYLNSLRLKGDYVKILNQNQVKWRGHIYTK